MARIFTWEDHLGLVWEKAISDGEVQDVIYRTGYEEGAVVCKATSMLADAGYTSADEYIASVLLPAGWRERTIHKIHGIVGKSVGTAEWTYYGVDD